MNASLSLRLMMVLAVSLISSVSARTAQAQPGQVVQLPTFNFFTVSTTVSAPDRGAISLGGVRSLREGSNTRGVPMLSKLPGLSRLGKNRGIGRESSASGLTVHPFIIDKGEMEAELMAAAAASRVTEPAMVAFRESIRKASHLSSTIAASSSPLAGSATLTAASAPAASTRSTPPGVAAIKRRNALANRAKMDEAMQFFQRAERAADEGKLGVAKIYYRSAGKRGNSEMKALVAERMKQLQQQQSQDQR